MGVLGEEVHGWAGTYDLVVSTRLESARLVTRTFEACDAGPWLAMVTDPEVRRFLPAGPVPTVELARRIIREREAMKRELGRPEEVHRRADMAETATGLMRPARRADWPGGTHGDAGGVACAA
jgi:hypothetical protein